MSVHQASDSIVHHRSNTKQMHPLVRSKRVSFHEDVVEPGNGDHLIQIRIGEYGEREEPEGQEDPLPTNETSLSSLSKSLVFKKKIPKFPSLYLSGLSNFDLKSQQIVLKQIQLELACQECKNVQSEHLDLNSYQFVNIIKKDLPLMVKESVYKVSTYTFK